MQEIILPMAVGSATSYFGENPFAGIMHRSRTGDNFGSLALEYRAVCTSKVSTD